MYILLGIFIILLILALIQRAYYNNELTENFKMKQHTRKKTKLKNNFLTETKPLSGNDSTQKNHKHLAFRKRLQSWKKDIKLQLKNKQSSKKETKKKGDSIKNKLRYAKNSKEKHQIIKQHQRNKSN